MLSRHTETSRATLIILDQALLALAYGFAVALVGWLGGTSLPIDAHLRVYLVALFPVMLGLCSCGLYRPHLTRQPLDSVPQRDLVMAGWVMFAMIAAASQLPLHEGQATPGARGVAFMFFGLGTGALWLSRVLSSVAERRLVGDESQEAGVLVFGMSRRMLQLLATFQRTPGMNLRLDGVTAENASDVPPDIGPRLTKAEAFDRIVQGHVEHVLIEATELERDELARLFDLADQEGISVHLTASMFPSTNLVPTWERVGGVPLLGFVSAELSLGARIAKRSFDVIVSSMLLVLLAIPMLVIATIIRLTTNGPAFFIQERVGEAGRSFKMVKFRTMTIDAEDDGPRIAVTNDPRCTRVGGLLRRTNLDELPQLLNVLRGEMSLVGPRPERAEFIDEYKREIPRYAHKHWVKPGITGWAQIHGLRGSHTSLRQRIEHDVYYIENWSLVLDIRILVRTVFDGYLNAA